MRLSCRSVASLCLGAAAAGAGPGGITSAFIVQPVSLRQRQPASLSGGQRQQQRQQQHAAPFAQSGVRQEHSTSVTTIVMTAPVNTNLNNSDANSKQPRLFSARRGAIFRATRSLLSRGRQFVSTKRISRGEQEATAAALSSGEGQGGISKSRVGRGGRGWVRRTAASAAAAIVLRVALSPLSASAVPPMRGMGRRNTQSQQQRIQNRSNQNQRAMEEYINSQLDDEMMTGVEGQEDGLVEQGVAASGVEGRESLTESAMGGAPVASLDGDTAAESRGAVAAPPVRRKRRPGKKEKKPMTREQRRASMQSLRQQIRDKEINPNAVSQTQHNEIMGNFASAGLTIFLVLGALKGSTGVMESQRKRVKTESSKFEQQKEEWIDVEGQAEVDVDIMKELRDLKEKMAGPGDDYASETRAYNPDFAKDHPEEEYEDKIQKAMRERERLSKKRAAAFKKKKMREAEAKAKQENKSDDLLDDGHDQSEAEAAKQAGKDADTNQLNDLFNSSPDEDSDDPEDDQGDRRDKKP